MSQLLEISPGELHLNLLIVLTSKINRMSKERCKGGGSNRKRTAHTRDARVHIPREGRNSSSDIRLEEAAACEHCGP